jgi:hypothetical protein
MIMVVSRQTHWGPRTLAVAAMLFLKSVAVVPGQVRPLL